MDQSKGYLLEEDNAANPLVSTQNQIQQDSNMVTLTISKEEIGHGDNSQPHKGGSLSIFGAALTVMSTIVGGGIVGLPYAFLHTSIPIGIALNSIFSLVTIYSCYLYLKAKDFTGNLK